MNLLPFKEQKAVVRSYHVRLLTVALGAATVLVLIGLVLLAPAYYITNQKETLAEQQLAQVTQNGAGSGVGAEDPKEVVRRIEEKVAVLLPREEQGRQPTETIEAFLVHQTHGITIDSLFLDVDPKGGRMTISGSADRRESLAAFEEDLKADPRFANVSIPRSSYLKPTNIDFSITIMLAEDGGSGDQAAQGSNEQP